MKSYIEPTVVDALGIKVCLSPGVYLVSTPALDVPALGRFVTNETTNPQWWSDVGDDITAIPEIAGRLCYQSFANPRPGGNAAYLQHILEAGHFSVIEHINISMVFVGVSRSLTHELVRHRIASYSQESQRYIPADAVRFVLHPALRYMYDGWRKYYVDDQPATADADKTDAATFSRCVRWPVRRPTEPGEEDDKRTADAFVNWTLARRHDLYRYKEVADDLVSRAPEDMTKTERLKWARQAAREELPNCAEARIWVTMNMRSWRHFIDMRASRHADMQIRVLAGMVFELLSGAVPALLADYTCSELPDGTKEYVNPRREIS